MLLCTARHRIQHVARIVEHGKHQMAHTLEVATQEFTELGARVHSPSTEGTVQWDQLEFTHV